MSPTRTSSALCFTHTERRCMALNFSKNHPVARIWEGSFPNCIIFWCCSFFKKYLLYKSFFFFFFSLCQHGNWFTQNKCQDMQTSCIKSNQDFHGVFCPYCINFKQEGWKMILELTYQNVKHVVSRINKTIAEKETTVQACQWSKNEIRLSPKVSLNTDTWTKDTSKVKATT